MKQDFHDTGLNNLTEEARYRYTDTFKMPSLQIDNNVIRL